MSELKRDYNIDLLKVIAIFGVLIIHSCNYNSEIASLNWVSAVFWGTITRASVPIFLMTSGAMMLEPKKELGMKKLYLHNFLRIVIAMVFWAWAYKLFYSFFARELSIGRAFEQLGEVLLFQQEFHFYYLHMIIIVYMFLPITRIITKYADKKQLEYTLFIWLLFGIVYPTLRLFKPFSGFDGIVGNWVMTMPYAAIGYGLLGYYLKKYPPVKSTGICLTISGFAVIFWGTYIASAAGGEFYSGFMEGMSVGTLMLAVGIYTLIDSVTIKPGKFAKCITWLSKASFCVYLVHIFFLRLIEMRGFSIDLWYEFFTIPALAIVVFVCSIAVYAVLSKIPLVRKWLI